MSIEAFLQHGTAGEPMRTESVQVKVTDPPRCYSATGYGSRLPTRYMVQYLGRWRRVYARCWSNVASYYIGRGDGEVAVTLY